MHLLDWLTKPTGILQSLYRAQQETMDARSSSTSAIDFKSQTQTQAIPTLSFDLSAPTGSSSGWTVNKVWGAESDNSNDFAKRLQDTLNRTETFSILDTLLYRHIVAFLAMVWSVMLWRKLRSNGMKVEWVDGLAVVLCAAGVLWRRDVVLAIGVTAGYVAWAMLAAKERNEMGGLPGFETFAQGLKPADEDQDRAGCEGAEPVAPSAHPASATEAALLTKLEANLGLPSKKPREHCIVCWSSSSSSEDEDEDENEETSLKLPCSHLVCTSCLTRLKEANKNTCPFCRRPLYTLSATKTILFQLVSATSGAQPALALVLAALHLARGRYWGAATCLVSKAYPAAAALWSQRGLRTQGEEAYFAGTSQRVLQIQLGLSVYLLWGVYGGIEEVGWATFVDGSFVRGGVDEWWDVREVVCWVVPGLAGKVVRC